MVPKEVPYFPVDAPPRPLFFRSLPELSLSPPKVTKKGPKATNIYKTVAKKTHTKAPEYGYHLGVKKSK